MTGTSPKPSSQAWQLLLAPWNFALTMEQDLASLLAEARPHRADTSQSGCPKHIREPGLD